MLESPFIVAEGYIIKPVDNFKVFTGFSCGVPDIDEFFCEDAERGMTCLSSKTIILCNSAIEDTPLVAAALLADALKIEEIAEDKKDDEPCPYTYKYGPAMKIGRLGTNSPFKKMGLASAMLDGIARLVLSDRLFGCRYLTVDALPDAEKLYTKFGFRRIPARKSRKPKRTIAMYLDLYRYRESRYMLSE